MSSAEKVIQDTTENREKGGQEVRAMVKRYYDQYALTLKEGAVPSYGDFMKSIYGYQEKMMQQQYWFMPVGQVAFDEFCKLAEASEPEDATS